MITSELKTEQERWQRIKEIFDAAVELDEPERRAAFVAERCAGDEALRRQVESLLANDETGFIEQPAFGLAAQAWVQEETDSTVGRRIGAYRVIRELGHGGMGAVYLAARDDQQFQQQVAIKLIKRGMDTDAILRRFRNERQILANLHHPNIARLLDGGTTEDGLPYFVLEYIEGQPINEYVDAHKLSIVERLKLFRTVCAAVQYAHQNLVIHRDIKPSNILITAEGVPKLLDFGIAKLLHADLSSQATEATATALGVMTPEYASPEQARGENVTTVSDVYSLGVLLYELLTGHRPYRFKSRLPHDIAQAICHEQPERPSTSISDFGLPIADSKNSPSNRQSEIRNPNLLRGDLDNIVLMAMRKEPQRRYASVEQFSEDIRRHLEGLPVRARKDTLSYRSSKFIQRNKAAVLAATLIIVMLLAGVIITTWQARVARAQRAIAERRFNDVRKLANLFLFKYHDEIEKLPGSTPAREMLVKDALNYLDSLAREASGDSSLQRELAAAYLKVGHIQGKPFVANLGDTAGALESYRKAQVILEALLMLSPSDKEVLRDLSLAYENIGIILERMQDVENAVETQRKTVEIRERLLQTDPINPEYRRLTATAYLYFADAVMTAASPRVKQNLLGARENLFKAQESYRKSLAIREELAAADPMNAELSRELAQCLQRIGFSYQALGSINGDKNNYRLALESQQKALAIRQKLVAADPTNAQHRRRLAAEIQSLGDPQAMLGDTSGALKSYHQALAIFESLASADTTNSEARRDITNTYPRIARVLSQTGDLAGALKNYRLAVELYAKLMAADPTRLEDRFAIYELYLEIGALLKRQGHISATLEKYRQAAAIMEQALSASSQLKVPGQRRASFRYRLAEVYFLLGTEHEQLAMGVNSPANIRKEHWRAARDWYQRSLEAWMDLRDQGQLSESLLNKPDEVARRIAECDEAIVKLQGSAN